MLPGADQLEVPDENPIVPVVEESHLAITIKH